MNTNKRKYDLIYIKVKLVLAELLLVISWDVVNVELFRTGVDGIDERKRGGNRKVTG